jgi:hypothetical protein
MEPSGGMAGQAPDRSRLDVSVQYYFELTDAGPMSMYPGFNATWSSQP